MGFKKRIKAFKDSADLKKRVHTATKGIDNCPICREHRKQIIEHAKIGHPNYEV